MTSNNQPMATDRTAGVVKASSTMAIGTLVSRITGFVAKIILLAFLGAWIVNDSYLLANTLPNIIFELLVGGVLTSVAIPLLSRARGDSDGGRGYTQQLVTVTVAALALTTVIAVVLAPLIVRAYQGGDNADAVMATRFAYLLLPEIFFYGLAALFQAILNTNERFAAPAWAPAINNLVVIGVGITLFSTAGGTIDPLYGMAALSTGQFLLLGLGTTFGIVLQAVVLLPSLRRSGFRFRWRWGLDSRMAEAGRLMAWVVAYTLVSQAAYMVVVKVANHGRTGFYTVYVYGSMLFQLPYGILGVSLLTAIMPRMSRHAAAGAMRAVKHDLSVANRLSSVALLPATAAMVALAVPLTTITVRYGKFADEQVFAFTLAAFAIGLLPLAITLVQTRVFYAMKDGRTPTLINAVMVAVRIPLLLSCLALPGRWVVPGLALATSASYIVGVAVGEFWLHRRFGTMGFGSTLSSIGRVALASALGGLTAWWVTTKLLPIDQTSFAGAVASLVVGGVVGLVVVGAGLLVLRVEEVDMLRRRLVSKFGRPQPVAASDALGDSDPGGNAAGDSDPGDDAPGDDAPGDRARGDSAPSDMAVRQVSVTDPANRAVFSPGTVIGERYRLTALVTVDTDGYEYWQARDQVLPRDMALTLLPSVEHTAGVVTSTVRVGRLDHPSLPQVLDVGVTETRHGQSAAYIASPWVDGASLPEVLQSGPLDVTTSAALCAQVTDAVDQVHTNGWALGALPPSLVRISGDGQARLSHVISHPSADAKDDIRGCGALLYLMLTARWPLEIAADTAALDPAPRRGDTEQPADQVNSLVPAALAALATRALHPDSRQGIAALSTMTGLLRPAKPRGGATSLRYDGPQGGSGAGGRGSGRSHAPRARRASTSPVAAAAGAADQDLIRERRVKISIASGMMAVLLILAVIVSSSLIKQFMASISEPIKASNNERLIDVTTPTTTKTVGGTTDTSDSSQTSSSGPTSTSPEAKPITVAGASVYDPQGTPPADYTALVDQAFDGDMGTHWQTWVYNQQFGPGGIKDGVGLLLHFDKDVTPASVTVSSATPGTRVEIRSADSKDPSLDSTTVLGKADLESDPVSMTLSDAPSSAYLLVWITELAPYRGDSAKNQGKFQSDITEITVKG